MSRRDPKNTAEVWLLTSSQHRLTHLIVGRDGDHYAQHLLGRTACGQRLDTARAQAAEAELDTPHCRQCESGCVVGNQSSRR